MDHCKGPVFFSVLVIIVNTILSQGHQKILGGGNMGKHLLYLALLPLPQQSCEAGDSLHFAKEMGLGRFL